MSCTDGASLIAFGRIRQGGLPFNTLPFRLDSGSNFVVISTDVSRRMLLRFSNMFRIRDRK